MEEEKYPSDFFRGIPTKDYVYVSPDIGNMKAVKSDAFQFDVLRDDGYREMSINWNDDSNSIKLLFDQKRDNGKYHFQAGAVKIDLASVKQLFKQFIDSKEFAYERKKLDDNPYHGNLLAKDTAPKETRKKLMYGLSLIAESVIDNPNCSSG